jgi:hypothetical protein
MINDIKHYYDCEAACVPDSFKKRLAEAKKRAKREIEPVKDDFERCLPSYVREALDRCRWSWNNEDWFIKAYEEYRSYVLKAAAANEEIKGPGVVFNKYIDEAIEKRMTEADKQVMHSIDNVNVIEHARGSSSPKKLVGDNGVVYALVEKMGKAVAKANSKKAPSKAKEAVANKVTKTATKVASKTAAPKTSKSGDKARAETMANAKNGMAIGKMILTGLLVGGAITAITVGVIKRRQARKNSANNTVIAEQEDKVNRRLFLKNAKAQQKVAIEDAKTQAKINKILEDNTGDGTGPERWPAGSPNGLGGQFKPKGA